MRRSVGALASILFSAVVYAACSSGGDRTTGPSLSETAGLPRPTLSPHPSPSPSPHPSPSPSPHPSPSPSPSPSTGCTFTKGWYRNNGEETIIAVDGRSVADVETIFDAKPGQPGGVTWQGGNNVLNLYQQLLAALQNLGGDPTAGPDAVDAAVADALNATGGTGLNITITGLTQAQISSLINVLSSFNEGEFAGWPDCDD